MSGALSAVSSVAGIGVQALRATGIMPAMFGAVRSIGDSTSKGGKIIPDVTIEENHSDRLTVTQHPIAKGMPISDHAYKMPATVTMRLGFSNVVNIGSVVGNAVGSVIGGGSVGSALSGAGSSLLDSFTEQRVTKVYQQLRDLQFDQTAWDKGDIPLKEFKLVTGKRTYPAMVITELSVRTDRTSEYSLMVEVHMQEVRIVATSSTTQPAQTDQANPQKTASPTDQPDKSATPPSPPGEPGSGPSLITRAVGGIGDALKGIGGLLGYPPSVPAPP